MGFTPEELKEIMIMNNMPVYLMKNYVNGILIIKNILQLGSRFNRKERNIKVSEMHAAQE